jgi:hypothetical protein
MSSALSLTLDTLGKTTLKTAMAFTGTYKCNLKSLKYNVGTSGSQVTAARLSGGGGTFPAPRGFAVMYPALQTRTNAATTAAAAMPPEATASGADLTMTRTTATKTTATYTTATNNLAGTVDEKMLTARGTAGTSWLLVAPRNGVALFAGSPWF